jgi:hypothetical protein
VLKAPQNCSRTMTGHSLLAKLVGRAGAQKVRYRPGAEPNRSFPK